MRCDLGEIEVVAPNFNSRFSGVTATILALLPWQSRRTRIAAIGPRLPRDLPRIGWSDILRRGWRAPSGRPARIWHARRNNEMLVGLLLNRVLRQPWRLVFTSAAQRHHTRYTRLLIRRMDAVISTSPQAASYLRVPSTIIMHGVDTARFRPEPEREAAWAATGLPGRWGIGIFGRIRHQKGTDLFVEAMCGVLPPRPEWTAVIIGLAKPSERAFVAALQARIAAAGLQGRILFLGEEPTEAIPAWFRRLAAIVAPARREGFGLVPLEAMASGTPIIASRAGAAADLVVDGVTGRLVPANDLEALRSAAEWLMDMEPARRAEMERAARRHVETRHSIEHEADAIQAVYDRLLAPALDRRSGLRLRRR